MQKKFAQFKKKQYLCTRFSKKAPTTGSPTKLVSVGKAEAPSAPPNAPATLAQLVEQRIRNA